MEAALQEQESACSTIAAVLAGENCSRVTPALIALCVIDPSGVDGATGAPCVRADMDSAIERVSAAVMAAAKEAQIVSYDSSLTITGAGGWSVLEQFPAFADKSGETSTAAKKFSGASCPGLIEAC